MPTLSTHSDKEEKLITVKTDGAARGNPGPAGVGVVIYDSKGEIIDEAGQYIGEATNNVAEYSGLLLGLRRLAAHRDKPIVVELDSELLVKQLNGEYKVKNAVLKPMFLAARAMLNQHNDIQVRHIPRTENSDADKLANEAIDKYFAGETQIQKVVETPDQESLF